MAKYNTIAIFLDKNQKELAREPWTYKRPSTVQKYILEGWNTKCYYSLTGLDGGKRAVSLRVEKIDCPETYVSVSLPDVMRETLLEMYLDWHRDDTPFAIHQREYAENLWNETYRTDIATVAAAESSEYYFVYRNNPQIVTDRMTPYKWNKTRCNMRNGFVGEWFTSYDDAVAYCQKQKELEG